MASVEKELEKIEERELHRSLNEVLTTAEGVRVLYWIMSQSGIYQTSFAGEATHATAFNLGKREVGSRLLGLIDTLDINAYSNFLRMAAGIKDVDKMEARSVALNSTDEEE